MFCERGRVLAVVRRIRDDQELTQGRQSMPLIKPRHHVWTEAEVLALAGESDHFDRKSGKLLEDKDVRGKLSKAVGAFANSGGGHVFLGVADDTTFDGVDPLKGRQPTREYVETLATSCTSYPVSSVTVNEVVRDPSASKIPMGRVVLSISVDDSQWAPHQSLDNVYYYRQGGKSVPAPHQMLDLMRHRPARAVLNVVAARVDMSTGLFRPGSSSQMMMTVIVENTSRTVSARAVKVLARLEGDGLVSNVSAVDHREIKGLLPGCRGQCALILSPDVRPEFFGPVAPEAAVHHLISTTRIYVRAASDSFAGSEEVIPLADTQLYIDGKPYDPPTN